MTARVKRGVAAALAALVTGGAALAAWSSAGRAVAVESYDRSSVGVHFTTLPGEDALEAALACANANRKTDAVFCFAYTSRARFDALQGKVRVCYDATARRFGDEVSGERVKRRPSRCPAGR